MKTLITRIIGMYLNFLGIVAPRIAGKKGFLIFCRPFRSPLNSKQLEFLNSGEKFTIEHNENSIQGYKWGNGDKKLLFIHGWQSHTYRWKAYIESLSKDEYTIYALDAPGHGLSAGNFLSVPVYSDLIEKLIHQIGEVDTAIAHSIGSFSLLYTFYRKNDLKVNNLILMAAPGEAKDFVDVFRTTLKLTDRTIRLITDHFMQRYRVTPDFFSAIKFADSVNAKSLLIHDEYDDEAPYQYAVQLSSALKNSRLITTKGLGHNLKSNAVVKYVNDFIASQAQEVTL